MDTILTKAAEQVPNLAVLSFIVWMFLKHLKTQSDSLAEAARHSRSVIEENTKAAAANTGALNSMSTAIFHLTKEVKQQRTKE